MNRIVALALIGLLLLGAAACVPEKPTKDGPGPLSVRIDREFVAPEYHSPLEWWQTHHFRVVNSGDVPERDCLYCHKPEKSCNNCHGYVGVKQIEEARGASLK
jgi:hypothetical protein